GRQTIPTRRVALDPTPERDRLERAVGLEQANGRAVRAQQAEHALGDALAHRRQIERLVDEPGDARQLFGLPLLPGDRGVERRAAGRCGARSKKAEGWPGTCTRAGKIGRGWPSRSSADAEAAAGSGRRSGTATGSPGTRRSSGTAACSGRSRRTVRTREGPPARPASTDLGYRGTTRAGDRHLQPACRTRR